MDKSISTHRPQPMSAKRSEDGNSSAAEEEDRNTDECDEEQRHSEDKEEEDGRSFCDDEQYDSKTHTPTSLSDFECAMQRTRRFLQQRDYCQANSECRKALEMCPGHEEAEELSSKLFHLINDGKEDVERDNEDNDDSHGRHGGCGNLEDGCNKESDEEGLLTETADDCNEEIDEEYKAGDEEEQRGEGGEEPKEEDGEEPKEEDGEEPKEEDGEEQRPNETAAETVDCDEEEETESEDSEDEEILERLINKGKMASKSKNYEDALVCFKEANEICGGSDALKKYIECIERHLNN